MCQSESAIDRTSPSTNGKKTHRRCRRPRGRRPRARGGPSGGRWGATAARFWRGASCCSWCWWGAGASSSRLCVVYGCMGGLARDGIFVCIHVHIPSPSPPKPHARTLLLRCCHQGPHRHRRHRLLLRRPHQKRRGAGSRHRRGSERAGSHEGGGLRGRASGGSGEGDDGHREPPGALPPPTLLLGLGLHVVGGDVARLDLIDVPRGEGGAAPPPPPASLCLRVGGRPHQARQSRRRASVVDPVLDD